MEQRGLLRRARNALFAGCALAWFVAILILSILLQWQGVWPIEQKVALGLTVWSAIGFAGVAAFGLIRELLPTKRIWSVFYTLVGCSLLHLGSGIWLSVVTSQQGDAWKANCITSQSEGSCSAALVRLNVLLPLTIVILPICGPLVASYLYRFLTSESSDPFSYTADVPPDWHIPPAELAPDSSDSGGEMEYYELGSTKSGYASPRPTAMVELSEADGQPESQSKQIDRSKWSKVRRDRKRQVSGAYGRLADV